MAKLTYEEKLKIIGYNCHAFNIGNVSEVRPTGRIDLRIGGVRFTPFSSMVHNTVPYEHDANVISNAYDMVYQNVWHEVVMAEVDRVAEVIDGRWAKKIERERS